MTRVRRLLTKSLAMVLTITLLPQCRTARLSKDADGRASTPSAPIESKQQPSEVDHAVIERTELSGERLEEAYAHSNAPLYIVYDPAHADKVVGDFPLIGNTYIFSLEDDSMSEGETEDLAGISHGNIVLIGEAEPGDSLALADDENGTGMSNLGLGVVIGGVVAALIGGGIAIKYLSAKGSNAASDGVVSASPTQVTNTQPLSLPNPNQNPIKGGHGTSSHTPPQLVTKQVKPQDTTPSGTPQTMKAHVKPVSKVQIRSPKHYLDHPNEWPYPSDHLPVSGRVETPSGMSINFVTYNTLNRHYIGILNGTSGKGGGQSIKTSKLGKSGETDLNLRDHANAQLIDTMSQKSDIVALQEVSPELFKKIQMTLPPGYKTIPDAYPTITGAKDTGIIVYNGNNLSLTKSDMASYNSKQKYIQRATFSVKKGGEEFEVVNTHVPLGELAKLASELSNPPLRPTFVMGDFNKPVQDLKTSGLPHLKPVSQQEPDFVSHWNTKNDLVTYDGIFQVGPPGQNPWLVNPKPTNFNAQAQTVYR